ncbi:MAG: SDR family oxidoreductase [Planctomycetota bacterium]|nr:SDR family oxidoreductase [Planctomycetota bacterium]
MIAPEQNTRVVLITGGGQGIGRGIAARLVAEGHRVHVNVRSDVKRARLAREESGMQLHGGDLTRAGDAEMLVEEVLAASGRLDAVVHAVGPYVTAPVSETPAATYRDLMEGNLMTAIAITDASRQALRQASGAYLFFGVAGLERWRARSVTTAYVAAKSALLCYVRGLAREEAAHGVRANMISPGFVPHDGAAPDTLAAEMHQRIPQGRPATMEEVTGLASFLVSPTAGHIVGQNIEVAGGWML